MITPIQTSGSKSVGQVATFDHAFTADVTAGSTLIVAAGSWYLGDVGTTCTDTQGNTYALRVSGSTKIRYWVAVAGMSGPCTVTVASLIGVIYLAVGVAELPAGSYSYADINAGIISGTTPSTDDFEVSQDGAALFAMLTPQGNPAGSIAENGAWTLISKYEGFVDLPYSWIWRNADIGTYQASWTVGASITSYSNGLLVEGVPDGQVITGSLVAGVTTTVKATRAIAFGLDGNTNVHDEPGKFKVFGRGEYTEDLIVIDPVNPTDAVTKRYCDANAGAGGGAYRPLTLGTEPLVLVSDGAGELIMVPFTP